MTTRLAAPERGPVDNSSGLASDFPSLVDEGGHPHDSRPSARRLMSRFASASKALRGPFKRLVQKLRLLLKRPLIRRTPKGTRPPTTPGHAPTPQTLADQVAKATGGTIRPNKGGFTVDIPHGRRLIVLRVMDHGGARENYYRVSVAGKTMYTVTGEVSSLRDLTHIPVGESSMADILAIIVRIKGGS